MIKRIILTGGGTAGHVTPCIAVAKSLDPHEWEIHYAGRPSGIEKELAEKNGFIYHEIDCPKFNRSKPWTLFTMPCKLARAKKQAKLILKSVQPNIIFSKGGYVSLPIMLANKTTPIIMHESDLSFGLANKLARKKCTVCSSFPMNKKDVLTVGSPLSPSLSSTSNDYAKRFCSFSSNKPVLLVTGGSLGAKALNNRVLEDIDILLQNYNIIHITGKGYDYPRRDGYCPIEFTSHIYSFMKYADLAITRGGSNTIFELAELKVPALIIPLPKGVSRGDQIQNAQFFASHGYAITATQNDIVNFGYMPFLAKLNTNKDEIKRTLNRESFNGTKKISKLINKLAN